MNYQILNNNNNNNNNDNNNNDNNNNENNNENNNNENNNNDKNVNENGQKENENNQNSNVEQKNGQKKKNWWKRKIDWFGSSEIKKKKNNHSNFTNNNNNDDKNNKNNNDKKNEIKKYDKNDFGAVCVMGELRQFEKTVSGIFQYFVRYLAHHFKRIDVFFSSFINPESYKIFLAIKEWELLKRNLPPNSEVRLLAIRMPFQYPNQYSPYRNVTLPYSLTGDDGIFGLFNLTLGCNQMILEQEEKEGFKYDRIFKTRVDSLWYDFPKNLSFSQNCVFLPKKYNYGGHNDRFLMGLRDDMIIANDRFEALHKYPPLKRFANSEFSLKMEFRRTHLCVRLILDIPFCVYRSLSKHADGLITEFPSRIHPINNGGTCRECQRGNCTNFTASERQALFIQQAGVGAAKPIFLLEEIIGKISSIDDCEKILSLEIRDFWNSDSTIKDVCIFGKDEIEAQQKRQEKLEPEFERNLFFISEQVSSTAKRALMVWDNESTCLRFPITCTEKEKLQIEIRNRERDLALLANKSKPNKTIESVQRDWSGVPALLFSRHRRISRKKPRKIDEEKEVGNGGILGFFKTIFGVF